MYSILGGVQECVVCSIVSIFIVRELTRRAILER
jgi:hypothetical protein